MIDNKYKLVNILGSGGSAKVFLAEDTEWNKVAVKVIHGDQKFAKVAAANLVQKEHDVLQFLEGHPNILKSLCYNINGVISNQDKSEGIMYNVLEHAENGALSNFIRYTGPLEEEIGRFFSYQICHALKYMHDMGCVHLDLKLENILLDEYFNTKIADMGSCADVSLTQGMFNKKKGTVVYMAPEVANMEKGKTYDAKAADAYTLGMAIFVMLVGEFPNPQEFKSGIDTMDTDSHYTISFIESSSEICKQRWSNLSVPVKELIKGLMHPESDKRLTVSEALDSSWLRTEFQTNCSEIVYEEMMARKPYMTII